MSDPLSHSCPTCGGTGWRPHHEDGEQPCPDCIDGYPKDRIERAAKALCEKQSEEPEIDWQVLRATYTDQALAAIRAFHTDP